MSSQHATDEHAPVVPMALLFLSTALGVVPLYSVSVAVFQFGVPEFYARLPPTLEGPLLSSAVTLLILCSHLLVRRSARNSQIGWLLPVLAVVILAVATLVATILIGFEKVRPVELVAPEVWTRADHLADVALVVGFALISVSTLVLPQAAVPRDTRGTATWKLLHGALLALVGFFGLVPLALAVWG